MSDDEALRRLEALFRVAFRLARTAPSGRILLATLAARLDPAWLPGPEGARVWTAIAEATAPALAPLPMSAVEPILREAWGAAPTEELDSLEPEPVASTPTTQVHRGTLDGKPVAVKVLRPGLAAAVRQDLALLEGLIAPLGAALPGVDPMAILRELRERVLDELDLEHEAGLQRRVARALRRSTTIQVPTPVTALSHENVLVSEWIDGSPLSEVPDGAQRDEAAGLVHADTDPADLRLTADGRLAVLDYGSTVAVPPARADHAVALVSAYAERDAAGLGAALDALGLLPAEHGERALALAAHTLGALGEEAPARLDTPALIAAAQRLGERPHDAVAIMLAAHAPADQLWPLRAVAQLFGTIARIGATNPWRELVGAALRDGWE
jgi:hypothetical protein